MRDLIVHRLSDEGGQYRIVVECRCCRHSRSVAPEFFARLCGWEATLDQVQRRLSCSRCRQERCGRCNARKIDMRVAALHRPRRWNKNPS